MDLNNIRIRKISPNPDCIRCNGEGIISTIDIGEYEEWINSKFCDCVKFKDLVEEN